MEKKIIAVRKFQFRCPKCGQPVDHAELSDTHAKHIYHHEDGRTCIMTIQELNSLLLPSIADMVVGEL